MLECYRVSRSKLYIIINLDSKVDLNQIFGKTLDTDVVKGWFILGEQLQPKVKKACL